MIESPHHASLLAGTVLRLSREITVRRCMSNLQAHRPPVNRGLPHASHKIASRAVITKRGNPFGIRIPFEWKCPTSPLRLPKFRGASGLRRDSLPGRLACPAVAQEHKVVVTLLSEGWCRRRDLNPHGFPHHPLRQALTSPHPSAFGGRSHRLPHPAIHRGDLKVRDKPCQSAFGIHNT